MTRARDIAWRFVPGIHPGMENLVRRADGQRSVHLDRHLSRCRVCREKAALIAEAAGRLNPRGRVLEELFDRIDLRIEAWCSLAGLENGKRRPAPGPVHRNLVQALELYFGTETARRIECCSREHAPEHRLVPATKPLFAAFLGQRAAESLASRIAAAT